MTVLVERLADMPGLSGRIQTLSVRPYRMAYETPFRTSRGIFTHREGAHVVATLGDGSWGVGEAASWPGFGAGQNETSRALAAVSKQIQGLTLEAVLKTCLALAKQSPEAACGVETACLDAWSRATGCSMAQLLSPEPLKSVSVHARVETAYQAQRAVAEGARVLKIKVGVAALADEVTRIGAVRAAVGDRIALRLDANGAWPMPVAERAVRLFSAFSPEWLEEPIAAGDWEGLRHLSQLANVPIAADESLQTLADLDAALSKRAVRVAVLKPMFLGGPSVTLEAVARARAGGLKVCITHAMESGVGRAMALHVALAAGITEACGLEPTRLRGDIGPVGPVDVGAYRLMRPSGPGLNVWPLGPV